MFALEFHTCRCEEL